MMFFYLLNLKILKKYLKIHIFYLKLVIILFKYCVYMCIQSENSEFNKIKLKL